MTAHVPHRTRERAVARLQRGYVGGSLGTQTFEHRVEAALATDSPGVLRQLISDPLPPSLVQRARRWLAVWPVAPRSCGLLALLMTGSSTVIGRAPSCDLVVADDSVSRRHAMLFRDGDRVIVTDLGSSNGTFVNGRWVTQAEVRPGDTLQLGQLDVLL
jgi:FHA domain-containing protein/uncharacterized protein DUF1707